MTIKILLGCIVSLIVISFTGINAQPAKIRIACIGNSITWGGLGDLSYPQQLQKKLGANYDVRNYGVSARTLLKNGDYPYWKEPEFVDARNFDPHIVIIKLGTNDSKPQNWIYKNEFFGDYMDMVAAFRMLHRHPQIYVCFPVPVFKTNWGINNPIVRDEIIPLIDSVRKTAGTYLIDFYSALKNDSILFSDGVHPNAVGYEKMAQIVYDTIMHGQSGVIRYFYSTTDTLNKNESTTFYWNTSENSQVFLNGNLVNRTDSLAVTPIQTTSYVLTTKGITIDSIRRTINYYPPGKIKLFKSNIPYFEKNIIDTISLMWKTGIGSSVTLNNIGVLSDGSQFVSSSDGNYFSLVGNGEMKDSQIVYVPSIESQNYNRALNRKITVSTSDWGFNAESINDGDTLTEWRSKSGKTQWISIDFGRTITVNKIILHWGKIYGTSYYLLLSKESGEVETISSIMDGDGGLDEISGLSSSGKSIKLFCLKNNSLDSPYQLKEFEVFGSREITNADKNENQIFPSSYSLEQNFPNPFNPATTIVYQLPSTKYVSLKIYNMLGEEITSLVNKDQHAGRYSVSWNSANYSSGVYWYRLCSGDISLTKKMLLLK